MKTSRTILWGVTLVVIGVLLLLDLREAFPSWLLIGPVCLGVGGVGLLLDQTMFARTRAGGWIASLLMICLSAATVTQDAELVVDEWSVWPFLAGAILLGVPAEMIARSRRRARAHAASSEGEPPRAAAA